MSKPIIVTGCGRSGTHWLANIMIGVHGQKASFEPPRITDQDVVVDSRLRHRVNLLASKSSRVVHLVRDGRDVVRSLHKWYGGGHDFERYCREWNDAIEMMDGYSTIRLEDLILKRDPSSHYLLPHWKEWDAETHDTFWRICGDSMRKHGYV